MTIFSSGGLLTYGLPGLLIGLILGALAIFLIPVFKIKKALLLRAFLLNL